MSRSSHHYALSRYGDPHHWRADLDLVLLNFLGVLHGGTKLRLPN
jgi:hypothetical protein